MAGLNKSKGLNKGKGLGALIATNVEKPTVNEKIKDSIVMMNISKVEPNKSQPRKNFNEDALNELADSIKEHGIIEPLIVQDRKTYYEIKNRRRKKMESCEYCRTYRSSHHH